VQNRVTYDDNGNLDEVVTDGGAHLEGLDDDTLFLSCVRADGSEVALWIKGAVIAVEERRAVCCKQCDATHLPNAQTDGPYILCAACGFSTRPK